MLLVTKPRLKVLSKDKLHMSRRPGCTAWMLLALSAIIFIGVFSRLTSNIYLLVILLLGEIMFALDSLGEWEDLILYRQENRAVVEKSVWTDKLCFGGSGELFSMRLVDIQHVGVSTEMGLFILHKSGETISLSVKGLTRGNVQDLKREINYFLNMSRLEYLDYTSTDLGKRILLSSDSEEHLLNSWLSKTRLRPATTCNESTVSSDNVDLFGGGETHCGLQQNLSYPTFMCGAHQLNSYHSANLRRGPYTENLTHLNYVKHTDSTTCTVVKSGSLSQLDKECD